MDPVAHTLVGAALAETGLKRLSRYATATLLIGANLPDVDVVADFWGEDTSLFIRRGWSHGILAMVVLPLVLAGLVWCWHQWSVRRNRHSEHEQPFNMRMIIVLSYLAVLSHPFLDWLNTYGVRLLMPFDGRWFYGDTLFIIDPWVWLLAAAGVVLARSSNKFSISAWVLLGGLMSFVILSTNLAPLPVKLTWCVGVILVVMLRWQAGSTITSMHVARAGVALLGIYIASVFGVARYAESQLVESDSSVLDVQANPLPGTPFSHRRIMVFDDEYQIVTSDGVYYSVPRVEPNAIVLKALKDESIRGFSSWMRYPYWKVEEQEDSWLVSLWDLRYQGPDMSRLSIGFVQVSVAKEDVKDMLQEEG